MSLVLIELQHLHEFAPNVPLITTQQSNNTGLVSPCIFPSLSEPSYEFTYPWHKGLPSSLGCVFICHRQASLCVYIGYTLKHTERLSLRVQPLTSRKRDQHFRKLRRGRDNAVLNYCNYWDSEKVFSRTVGVSSAIVGRTDKSIMEGLIV